ncbi:MAG: tetratricopeptide repeat protein [Kiritimatiellia bacterium]|jgi:tetratricopeptide (TPR) repeat protein|nr:tetratricopeptide repeat protein [Kiritimatiellia bacterium]
MIRTVWLLGLVWLGAGLGCGTDSGQKALKQGLAAYNEKNYAAAVTHLNRAGKRLTGSVPLYYHLGLAHLHQGEIEPAQAAFTAALELAPGHAASTVCLGQIAYLQNDLAKAQTCFGEALAATEAPEERARILTALGLTEMGRSRNDLARLYLIRAQQAHRAYAPAYYNLASLYRDAFNLREEALDQFELYVRLAARDDRHVEKAENNIKRLRLNLTRTREEAGEGLRRDPATAARLLQEGARLHAGRQSAKAVKAFRDALAADPLTFSAAYGLAMAYKAQGQRAEAMEAFRRAAQIHPDHQDSYLQAAELAFQLKRYAEAGKLLDRAIARSPFQVASAELMARIRYAETRLPEARAYGEYTLSLMRPDVKGRRAYEQWVRSLPVR